jgi:hypothetical protein
MSFFKNGGQEGKQVLSGTSGRGEDKRKGYRRVNMLEILCIHVQKWEKMRPLETILRMGWGKLKKNDRWGKFN